MYELTTPFVPAPLIALARKKGFDSYPGSTSADGSVTTFFRATVRRAD